MDGKGTPRALVRAKKRGACPSTARLYIVREQIYRSEFAAESIKINTCMYPLIIDGRTRIPAALIATTKGDADAEGFFLLARSRPSEVYGRLRQPVTPTEHKIKNSPKSKSNST
jgi:hypothetical protein